MREPGHGLSAVRDKMEDVPQLSFPQVDAGEIIRHVGGAAFARGKAYSSGNAVEDLTWDPDTGVLQSRVNGTAAVPYRCRVQLKKKHDAVTLLGQRLVLHGYGKYEKGPGPVFTEVDKASVMAFQKAQGWSGSDADGYPGPETWARLMKEPAKPNKPAPKPRRTPAAAPASRGR